eukprot:scaffold38004_cov166-Skeletonema_marinoi.AAC.1
MPPFNDVQLCSFGESYNLMMVALEREVYYEISCHVGKGSVELPFKFIEVVVVVESSQASGFDNMSRVRKAVRSFDLGVPQFSRSDKVGSSEWYYTCLQLVIPHRRYIINEG